MLDAFSWLWDKVKGGFQVIIDRINEAFEWLVDLVVEAFAALFTLLKDAAAWLFEQVLDLVIGILGLMDFSGLMSWAGIWAGVPVEVLEVLSAIGIGTALGIIVTAIGIRFALQLIPFVRLGS